MKEEIKIISYNPEIGDWDILIPIPPDVKFDRSYDPVIVINTVWELPAEFTERGIELLHPSELFLRSGVEYSFSAIFVKIEGGYRFVDKSPPISMRAPQVSLEMNYHFEKDNLKTEAEYFAEVEGLELSESASYFWIIDNNTDSIIYGEGQIIEIDQISGNRISGEKEITRDENKKFLTCSVGLENQFGEVKLYASEIKSLLFKKNDEGFYVKNLFGVGAIIPYWNDGELRNGYVFDMNGNCVKQFSVLSGEPLWLDVPVGAYAFHVEGIGSQKIIKASR